ncbi:MULTISPECIES: hypothetical protein [unclassified Mesorhizobium]|uniref:hypothetical protein n=1 Tax=unclassified Mesorhizobium TaxID=325217 RepID=UPI00333D94EA
MRVTADTNVLLRAYVADDEGQAAIAVDLLAKADIVAVSVKALCEFPGFWPGSTRQSAKICRGDPGVAEHREWLSSTGRQFPRGKSRSVGCETAADQVWQVLDVKPHLRRARRPGSIADACAVTASLL